jgi:hypothetical protein
VEIWEEEKGRDTILTPKIKQYRIQREMKKMDTQSRLQQSKDKLHQGTQQSPQKHPERRNSTSNQ